MLQFEAAQTHTAFIDANDVQLIAVQSGNMTAWLFLPEQPQVSATLFTPEIMHQGMAGLVW